MSIQRRRYLLAAAVVLAAAILVQGCGGRHRGRSVVSGTVADMNQNVLVDALVFYESLETRSLVSGAYRLENVPSGWRTIRAMATVRGETWIGSTAVEVLRDEPTMNVNIVLAPYADTTSISGTVLDDTHHVVEGARVFLILKPTGEGQVGPYGSIVDITDDRGEYVLEDVPLRMAATITASKVGFRNHEISLPEVQTGMNDLDFELQSVDLRDRPAAPTLDWIESYTMPDSITRSQNAFEAIRAYTSPRYRAALAKRKATLTRSTPPGSLIEIDLYWSDPNPSDIVAGYGIYRATSPSVRAIDFLRDTYATFYGDMGIEITPGTRYYYAVTAVDTDFLLDDPEHFNEDDPRAESVIDPDNILNIIPLDQIRAISPGHGATVSSRPTFVWDPLNDPAMRNTAARYTVYVYDQFPSLPLDPDASYGTDPAQFVGIFPVWHNTVEDPDAVQMSGPILDPGTYYWVVLATDSNGQAFSYGALRPFTVD